MNLTLNELKRMISEKINNISFSPHFYEQAKKRPYLSESLIIDSLKKFDSYFGFQIQEVKGELRYRIALVLSNKYNLVVVLEIIEEGLNIITAWKTNKTWQKTMQK